MAVSAECLVYSKEERKARKLYVYEDSFNVTIQGCHQSPPRIDLRRYSLAESGRAARLSRETNVVSA